MSRICYRFEVNRHFILAGNCPFRPNLGVFYGWNTPKFHNYTLLIPKGSSLHQTASFELMCAKIGSSRVCADALLKNKKRKKSHRTRICCPPRGVLTAHRIQTNFGRAGDLPNLVIHAKFEINWYKIVTLAKGWSFMFKHYCGGRH